MRLEISSRSTALRFPRSAFTLAAVLLSGLAFSAVADTTPWSAAGAESLNVTILSAYPVNNDVGVWDCASYVDGQGREFGLIGADSIYVVDLTDPRNPRRAAAFPPIAPPAVNHWVAIAIRNQYAYAAARHGPILILDLTDPYQAWVAGELPQSEFCSCSCGHPCDDPADAVIESLFIDERGILYVAGLQCGEGIHTYDLNADPTDPPWLCNIHERPMVGASFYAHDVAARDGILYVSHTRGSDVLRPRWDILDGDPLCPESPGECGDGQTPALISWFQHDDPDLHSHSSTLLEDAPYLMTCDEITNGHVRVWDVSDPADPHQVSEMQPDSTCHSVHHAYSRGRYAWAAWYNKGIQIFDMSDPYHPVRAGYYEHPPRWRDEPGAHCCDPLEGPSGNCSGVNFLDPFFPSGIFIASEGPGNMLIGRFTPEAASVPLPPRGAERGRAEGSLRSLGSLSRGDLRIEWTPARGATDRKPGASSGSRSDGADPPDTVVPESPPALRVFSAGGQEVAVLRAEPTDWPARAIYRWDGRAREGGRGASGVYFVRLAGRLERTRVLLIR